MDARKLHEAVKNATLFCRTKTWNGGETRFKHIDKNRFSVCAADDFVGIETVVEGVLPAPEWYVSVKELKHLEKHLREMLDVDQGAIDLHPEQPKTEPAEPEWWKMFDDMLDNLGLGLRAVTDWEINPERLNMLNRLEPKGEYPISFRHSAYADTAYVAFLYGPDTRGMLMPLDRDELPEEYKPYIWH